MSKLKTRQGSVDSISKELTMVDSSSPLADSSWEQLNKELSALNKGTVKDYALAMNTNDKSWIQEVNEVVNRLNGEDIDKHLVVMIKERHLERERLKNLHLKAVRRIAEDTTDESCIQEVHGVLDKYAGQTGKAEEIKNILVDMIMNRSLQQQRRCVGEKCKRSTSYLIHFKVGDIIRLNQKGSLCSPTNNPSSCKNRRAVQNKMKLLYDEDYNAYEDDCLFKVVKVSIKNVRLCILGTNNYITDTTDTTGTTDNTGTTLKIRKKKVDELFKKGEIKRILCVNENLPKHGVEEPLRITYKGGSDVQHLGSYMKYTGLELPNLFSIFDYILHNYEKLTIPNMIKWLDDDCLKFTRSAVQHLDNFREEVLKMMPDLRGIEDVKNKYDLSFDKTNKQYHAFFTSPIEFPTIIDYIKNQQDALYKEISIYLNLNKLHASLRHAVAARVDSAKATADTTAQWAWDIGAAAAATTTTTETSNAAAAAMEKVLHISKKEALLIINRVVDGFSSDDVKAMDREKIQKAKRHATWKAQFAAQEAQFVARGHLLGNINKEFGLLFENKSVEEKLQELHKSVDTLPNLHEKLKELEELDVILDIENKIRELFTKSLEFLNIDVFGKLESNIDSYATISEKDDVGRPMTEHDIPTMANKAMVEGLTDDEIQLDDIKKVMSVVEVLNSIKNDKTEATKMLLSAHTQLKNAEKYQKEVDELKEDRRLAEEEAKTARTADEGALIAAKYLGTTTSLKGGSDREGVTFHSDKLPISFVIKNGSFVIKNGQTTGEDAAETEEVQASATAPITFVIKNGSFVKNGPSTDEDAAETDGIQASEAIKNGNVINIIDIYGLIDIMNIIINIITQPGNLNQHRGLLVFLFEILQILKSEIKWLMEKIKGDIKKIEGDIKQIEAVTAQIIQAQETQRNIKIINQWLTDTFPKIPEHFIEQMKLFSRVTIPDLMKFIETYNSELPPGVTVNPLVRSVYEFILNNTFILCNTSSTTDVLKPVKFVDFISDSDILKEGIGGGGLKTIKNMWLKNKKRTRRKTQRRKTLRRKTLQRKTHRIKIQQRKTKRRKKQRIKIQRRKTQRRKTQRRKTQ